MWLLALVMLADSSHAFPLAVSPAESLQVTEAGAVAAAPVVLIPGLFGSAFAYRKVIPRLTAAGYRTLVIEPAKRSNERFTVDIDEALVNGGFYDLAKADVRLRRGGLYTATLGSRKFTFKVDAKAKNGKAPVISRLLRFPPG